MESTDGVKISTMATTINNEIMTCGDFEKNRA